MQSMTVRRLPSMARAAALAIAGLAASASLTACRETRRAAADAPCAPGSAPPVRIAIALPSGLNAGERDSVSFDPFADASLVMFDGSGRPMPALARSWETRDRRTWTFTLREGLRTQTGEALTASRVRGILVSSLSLPQFESIWRDVLSVDAPTDTTLVFRLARPNNGFLEAIAANRLATNTRDATLYAGPFRAVRDTPDEIDYEPFNGTWSGPPTVSGLRIRFFPTPRAAWAAFLRNEADMFYDVPPDAVSLLEQNRDVRLFNVDSRFTYILAFQQKHPLLRDARVRRALNLAVDREAIARRFFGAYARPSHGPFAPTYWAAEGAGQVWPYDPATARALLKEATGGRDEPIELVCLTTNQFSLHADIAAALEAQLELVHVRLRMVSLPVRELYPRIAKGDYDVISLPLNMGFTSLRPSLVWHSPQPGFAMNYSAADQALDALRVAESDEDARAAVREVMNVMYRDPPAVFVLPIPRLRAVRRSWRVPDTDIDIRRTLPYWTLAETPPCGR